MHLRCIGHNILIHPRFGGCILFAGQLVQLMPTIIIILFYFPLRFCQIAVEDFIRHCDNAGLNVLKEQNFIVNGGRLLVALVRFIRKRGIVLDIHSRFLEIAHRGQALDRGIVIAAVARLQATRVHDVLFAVLVALERLKGFNRPVVLSGLHVRDGLIVLFFLAQSAGAKPQRQSDCQKQSAQLFQPHE